ncbi:MAG: RtcB family protein, partial [Candidatus Bipolaricaulota bacterium]
WLLPARGSMRVPARIFADRETVEGLRRETTRQSPWSALRQIHHVACLPGVVSAALALPDVHPGYGFPIGGVAAFDLDDGVAVVGGVGFDINCGVRLLRTPLCRSDVQRSQESIGRALFSAVPAGLGSTGNVRIGEREMDAVLVEGARYAVRKGFGLERDLAFIEEQGCSDGADPKAVSEVAKRRERDQVGTLGSGNHYLEVQWVERVLDAVAARAFGLSEGQVVVSIHTGSRALGHQIGQDSLRDLKAASSRYGLWIPDPEMVCAPIRSPEGARFLSAVAAGANVAFANRQVIAHLVRCTLAKTCGIAQEEIDTVYDVGHNHAKIEEHTVDGQRRRLLVHRKGSTRAFGPHTRGLPEAYREIGHPTLVGGSMGTASYVLRGTETGMQRAFGSGIHGAGRALSRTQAVKQFRSEDIVAALAKDGIQIWTHSRRGIAEEAPGAYKDVERVVAAVESAELNRAVARLRPLIVIKG